MLLGESDGTCFVEEDQSAIKCGVRRAEMEIDLEPWVEAMSRERAELEIRERRKEFADSRTQEVKHQALPFTNLLQIVSTNEKKLEGCSTPD